MRAGRLLETSVDDKVTTSVKDDTGRVISRTDADGKIVSYNYDPFSRVTRETETQGPSPSERRHGLRRVLAGGEHRETRHRHHRL